jgi:hypothetical protein
MRYLSWLSLATLLLTATAGHAAQADTPAAPQAAPIGRPLPAGWLPLIGKDMRGSFIQAGSDDIALLMYKGDTDGVVIVPDPASGREISVIHTFSDSETNLPQLSLIKPGSYQPVCHDGGACGPAVNLATEAIGLCHGEASCEIIYFKDNSFHHITVTD